MARFPVAVAVTLAIQAAAALLWAGAAAARIDALEARVAEQAQVNERLARLEEQAKAARASLARIEARLQ